ncbi:hyalin-like [Amphiura filiformis]|uniref:hyalin-like n=1 Tax=Amphiura filiformis TaxID=82378 RepID=UPI003B20D3E8
MVRVAPGTTAEVATWIEPTATDNSGLMPTVTHSHEPGDSFTVGTTEVTYTFRDEIGNEALCTFLVIVEITSGDITPPDVTGCPQSARYLVAPGTESLAITWREPQATDDSGLPVTTTQTHMSGDRFPIGTTNVVYTFTDQDGNSATCEFSLSFIIMGDEIPPEITRCPSPATYVIPFGTQSRPVFWTEPTASDNSGSPVTVVRTHQPGSEFSEGTSEVVYTFRDQSGNEAVCRFTVTIVVEEDTTPPIISNCPAPITDTIPPGSTLVSVTWPEPIATDNSGMAVLNSRSHQPGDGFNVGVTEVRYVFIDEAGNEATCSFSITVVSDEDTTPPVISNCPDPIINMIPFGTTSVSVTWIEPTATDNSGTTPTVTKSQESGDDFGIGVTQVTYTFSDEAGNEATCEFSVTVEVGQDTTPPIINGCPDPLNFMVPPGSDTGSLMWIEPTATDNSGIAPRVTQSHQPGDSFRVGPTQVTYIFTDMAGNEALCSFRVTVEIGQDTTPPTINGCPDPLNIMVPPGSNSGSLMWTEPTATDNSGMTPRVTQSHQPGDSFPVGTTPVTYTFTDLAGNEAVCSFGVTVVVGQDTTPPMIDGCPDPLNIMIPFGLMSMTIIWTEPTATDNSGMTPTVTQSHQPGDSFPIGTSQVTYTFTDAFGNEATCSFSVTVDTGQDTTPPVVTSCPDPINIIIPVGMNSMIVTWPEPTATDNSGMTPTVTQSHESGSSFPVGTTDVIYRFADMAGNDVLCSFTVTVVIRRDTIPPVVTDCPNRRDIVAPFGMTSVSVTWTEPTVTDNSGMTPTVIQSHQSGDSFPVGMTQLVIYTFTDMAGNIATCTFPVTIDALDDTTPPVIRDCPVSSMSFVVPFGTSSRTVSWTEPTATDNSGLTPTVTQSHQPGGSFPIGTTDVTYTFTDMAGNMVVCSFSVIVETGIDTTPPEVIACPDSRTSEVPFGTPSLTVVWTEPVAIDDSGQTPTFTQTHEPGDSFPVGTTRVTYIFTDSSGNQAACIFSITIVPMQDTVPPVVNSCPSTLSYTVPFGTTSRIVTWTEPTAIDNSGMTPTVTQSHPNGGNFPVGTTQVTYTFSDDARNEVMCSFTITILSTEDLTPPVINNCPMPLRYTIAFGTSSRIVVWSEPTATDNSGIPPSVVRSHRRGDLFPIGMTEVQYTFTDVAGNSALCSFPVVIDVAEDTVPPVVIGCPIVPISSSIPFGTMSASVGWTEPTATDNSGITPSVSRSHRPGDNFPVGTTRVLYTFTDQAGNEAMCSFSINIDVQGDGTIPTITFCPASTSLTVPFGVSSRMVAWTEPTARDNSGLPLTTTQTHRSGESFPVGMTTVMYTFSDQARNMAVCSFTISIAQLEDTTPPSVTGCPGPVTEMISAGTNTAVIFWTEPTATDNSGMTPTVTQSYRPGQSFPVGTTQVSYSFNDQAGNNAVCSFTVTISITQDTIPPIIRNCPSSFNYQVPFGTTSRIATWVEPTATDNSGVLPSSIRTHEPGSRFSIGITTVTYIFTDEASNSAACSFTIEIDIWV